MYVPVGSVLTNPKQSRGVHLYLRERPNISSLDGKSAVKVVPIFTTPDDSIRNNESVGIRGKWSKYLLERKSHY